MVLENFYTQCNQGLINMSALANILELSLPTIYNRRKTKSFNATEIKKMIDLGLITPSDSIMLDWGRQVLENELLESSEFGKLDFGNVVIYELAFDHWYALQKLEVHG